MCIIQIWTTCTCSSAYKLVEKSNLCPWCMLRSHARNGNECQALCHRHSAADIGIPGFRILVNPKLVWNSWNFACNYGAASTCHGKVFVPFGARLGLSFSQTTASHNKHDGFKRERLNFGDEMISIASNCFQTFSCVNIKQKECCVIFLWIFGVRLDIFYALSEFSMHLCA